jgi:hypothetical protein
VSAAQTSVTRYKRGCGAFVKEVQSRLALLVLPAGGLECFARCATSYARGSGSLYFFDVGERQGGAVFLDNGWIVSIRVDQDLGFKDTVAVLLAAVLADNPGKPLGVVAAPELAKAVCSSGFVFSQNQPAGNNFHLFSVSTGEPSAATEQSIDAEVYKDIFDGYVALGKVFIPKPFASRLEAKYPAVGAVNHGVGFE